MNTDKPWISCKQAGEILNYTQRHITILIKKGKLKEEFEDGKYFIQKEEFFRAFPHTIKPKETKIEESINTKFLEEKICYLQSMLEDKKKENEFLREQLKMATSENSKMIDSLNGYLKFLERKVALNKLVSLENET